MYMLVLCCFQQRQIFLFFLVYDFSDVKERNMEL